MEIKIRRKMLEQKAAQGDSHALRELTEGPVVDIAKLAELGCGGKHAGGRDQVKALVVPPELTEHGEEVRVGAGPGKGGWDGAIGWGRRGAGAARGMWPRWQGHDVVARR